MATFASLGMCIFAGGFKKLNYSGQLAIGSDTDVRPNCLQLQ